MTDCASLTHLSSCGSFHRFGLRSTSFCSCCDLQQVTLVSEYYWQKSAHTKSGSTCRDWCRMKLCVVRDRDCVMGLLAGRRKTLGHSCAGGCPAEQRELPVKPARRNALQVSNGFRVSLESGVLRTCCIKCIAVRHSSLLQLCATLPDGGCHCTLQQAGRTPRPLFRNKGDHFLFVDHLQTCLQTSCSHRYHRRIRFTAMKDHEALGAPTLM